MKRLFKFKYPKIFLLISSIVLTYFIFKEPVVYNFFSGLGNLSYVGVFIGGFLFSFGFSVAFAVGFFIALSPSNLILASLIGGLGSATADLLIYSFMRTSFQDEFNKLERTKTLKEFEHIVGKTIPARIRRYSMYIFAGILIATPLPDEFGVAMLSGLTKIKESYLGIISFILHAISIYVILLI